MHYDTSTPCLKDPNDTSSDAFYLATMSQIVPPEPYFNRECRRYAKKHGLTLEEAFKRLYK